MFLYAPADVMLVGGFSLSVKEFLLYKLFENKV